MKDWNATTVRHIENNIGKKLKETVLRNWQETVLRTILARNAVPITDNASNFCNESLVSWLRKIGYMPYRPPPYHPQSNGIAERMVQTVKMGFKASSPFDQNIEAYITNLLLNYRTVPHVDRKQSPSALMCRQIRAPITMSFTIEEKVWYKRNKQADPERAKFILQKELNMVVLDKKGQPILTHVDQFRDRFELEMLAEEPGETEGEKMKQNKTWRKAGMT